MLAQLGDAAWGRHVPGPTTILKVVSATFYRGDRWAMVLSSLKSPPLLQGESCPCYLRGLHQSASRSPAQAWQGVLVAGSAMQRSSCPRSAVPRGCEKQARA